MLRAEIRPADTAQKSVKVRYAIVRKAQNNGNGYKKREKGCTGRYKSLIGCRV